MKVAVIGAGLIGGSVGLALRSEGHRVVGFEPNEEAAKIALERGCLDELADLPTCAQADVVFVCVPPRLLAETVAEVCRHKLPQTVVTDCGSVKAQVVDWLKETREPNVVPSHPMAGHEKSGPKYASAWMFRGARWIVTPESFTSKQAVQTLEKLIVAMGATPVKSSAQTHDRDVALLSHLPHVLAATLVRLASNLESTQASGGSWRDLTRVGGVDPNLWAQILTSNRREVSAVLAEFRQDLDRLQTALDTEDDVAVWEFFDTARKAKEQQS